MRSVTTVRDLRAELDAARAGRRTIALVPTMGFFHDGHLELMREARRLADERTPVGRGVVVVSLFVNPRQFGPTEDFARYPRNPDRDASLARDVGVDLMFMPSVEEMYPPGFGTSVTVGEAGRVLCGAERPGHFDGVATVVLKLFTIVAPDLALFGWKDAQQLLILRRMVRDFNLRVDMIGLETVREPDGLAMSSRNVFLSPEERAQAPTLHAALMDASNTLRGGGTVVEALDGFRSVMAVAPLFTLQFAEAVTLDTLRPLAEHQPGNTLVAAAARIGSTRLIDNVRL